MRRLSNEELATDLAVAIKTAPKPIRQGMRSKLPKDRDKAISALAEHLVSKLSNDGRMVLAADLIGTVGNEGRPGIFGVDEPDPTEFELTVIPRYKQSNG